MDTEILQDIGLTHAEIKIYVALLELGTATAGPLLEKTQLHNSVVHRNLHSLTQKGIISFIYEGKTKHYQATEPEQLVNYIEDKKKRFEKLIPELKAKQQLAKQQTQATMFRGIKGLTEVYSFMVNQKGEYNTFGGGEECAKRMGMHWWLNIHTKRVENNLNARQVFDESVRNDAIEIESKQITSVRYLSAEFAQFQETVIVGEYVAIAVFSDEPYAFLMHDKQVADGYRKYFELLWKTAKK